MLVSNKLFSVYTCSNYSFKPMFYIWVKHLRETHPVFHIRLKIIAFQHKLGKLYCGNGRKKKPNMFF